jgi:hypothetical protein
MPYWIIHFFSLHFVLKKIIFVSFRLISFDFILSDNFIYKGNFSWLSDSQSHFWLSRLGKKIMITVAKHMIVLVIIRSSALGFRIKLKGRRCTWLKKQKKSFKGRAKLQSRWTTFSVSFFKGNYRLWLFFLG